MIRNLILLLLLGILFPSMGLSQNTTILNLRCLQKKDGLGGSNIRKILQDNFGFVWIGTQDGLYRYDSKSFVGYNNSSPNKHKISGSDVRDFAIDSVSSKLWVITSNGGLDVIDLIRSNAMEYSKVIPHKYKSFLLTSVGVSGNLVFLGSERGAFVIDTKKAFFKNVNLISLNSEEVYIDKIYSGTKTHTYFLCRYKGIFVIDNVSGKCVQFFSLPLRFYDISEAKNGDLILGTADGIKVCATNSTGISTVKHNPFKYVPGSDKTDVFACREDQDNNIWFSNENSLIRINSNGREYSLVNGIQINENVNWLNAVYSIYADKYNNIWLGCQLGLAYGPNRQPALAKMFKSLSSDIRINNAYFIYPASDTIVYCCAENGLYCVNIITREIEAIDESKSYHYLFKDPFKRLLVSNDDGLFVYNKSVFIPLEQIYEEFKKLGKIVINSHVQVADSLIILGTENFRGLFVWNFRKRIVYNLTDSSSVLKLYENTVNKIYLDGLHKVWMLSDNSISIVDFATKACRTIKSRELTRDSTNTVFFDICRVKNYYYLASYGHGVIILDSNARFVKEITTENGLSNNGVYMIIPYRDSILFVTTNNGLSVISIDDLHVKCYFEENGLHSSQFDETSGNIFNNTIYAGGALGFTVIKPQLFSHNRTPPRLYINRLRVETTQEKTDFTNLTSTRFTIPNTVTQTLVFFSAINYSSPGRTIVQYKIDGIHSDWTIAQGDFINLIGMGPGEHLVNVRAYNEDSVFSPILSFTLLYDPKWYQTLEFKILVLSLVIGAIYALYKYRISQIRKQEAIRRRIASDLHDDIGSTLNSIKIYTNLAQTQLENKEYLVRANQASKEAISGLRDVIWVLDDKQDTIEQLAVRITQFAQPLCEVNNIAFKQQVDPDLYGTHLGKEEKRNIYMVLKESINNSIKYAECSQIDLIIGRERLQLYFIVKDNGKGFDINNPNAGNGLKNIKSRAKQVKYKASIKSAPAAGTEIKLSRPIKPVRFRF